MGDLNLINSFIRKQVEYNEDFFIEVFVEPSSGIDDNTTALKGTVNFVLSKKDEGGLSKNHSMLDVVSLNPTLVMTGWCPTNENARGNSRFYNDVAISNNVGSWGKSALGTEQLWWIVPTDWDRIDDKTKSIYAKNYEYHKNQEIGNE